jgi:hypothetical protein
MNSSLYSFNLNKRNALLHDEGTLVKSAFSVVKSNSSLQCRNSEIPNKQFYVFNEPNLFRNSLKGEYSPVDNYQNNPQPTPFQKIDILTNKILSSSSLHAASENNLLFQNKTGNIAKDNRELAYF